MNFTKREIERYIKREEKSINKCYEDIEFAKISIKVSRKAIKMWKAELSKHKK